MPIEVAAGKLSVARQEINGSHPGEPVMSAPKAQSFSLRDWVDLLIQSAPDRASPDHSESILSSLRPLARQASTDPEARRQLIDLLGSTISHIDDLLGRQINRILHHPRFQKLEASWRGLHYLLDQVDPGEGVKVRVLSVTWPELARDAEKALEFDQSALFHKVYEEEFGTPGGEPFGVLIGDYQIRHQVGPDHPIDDVAALTAISQVAAAAFAPFIAGAHPSLLELTSFTELERPLDFARLFEKPEYTKWRAFRDTEDARFVGLALPRVLMRLPYEDDRADDSTPFAFREEVEAPGGVNYLWGNAAYAFGSVLVRAFSQSRWLTDIRGVRRGEEGGGIVTGLPVHSFSTDQHLVAAKFSTDVAITDLLDRTLSDLGLIPLCPCKDSEYSAFYGNLSVQKPRLYSETSATTNAKVSSMLQYILCASRVAHYLKVMGRDRIGSFIEPNDLRNLLSNWLNKYTVDDANASPDVKARYPLRGADVSIRENLGSPGSFLCEMLLQPHSQSDELALGIKLVTQLAPVRSG